MSNTTKVGRRSHGGVYRPTADRAEQAAEAIRKWGFRTEIHRQTACVAFTKDERTFYWHPMKKQFRQQGNGMEWVRLPPGKGIVAAMLHIFGKEQLPNVTLYFAAMIDGYAPVPPEAVRARDDSAGESHLVGHARAENSRAASPIVGAEISAEDWAHYEAIDKMAHDANEAYERELRAEAEVAGYEGLQR
jgi:hypothetical protein